MDTDEKGKHAANVINVEDYLSKRMNKFAAVEPPPGYRSAVQGRASPRMYESGSIPNASQAALRQLGLTQDDGEVTTKESKVGRSFSEKPQVSPSSRSRPSPKVGDGVLFYKSPVRVRVGTPTNTVRPGFSPGRAGALRPRSPDPQMLRGTSPRWVYSPAKSVPTKSGAVEPKSKDSTIRNTRVAGAPETTKQIRAALESASPPDYGGTDYRSNASFRTTSTKAGDPPRYRTTPIPTHGVAASGGAPRSSSATSTHPRGLGTEIRGASVSNIRRRTSGAALLANVGENSPAPRGAPGSDPSSSTRSGSGGEQPARRLSDGRSDNRFSGRESGTSTPMSARSVTSRQGGDPMQPPNLQSVQGQPEEVELKPKTPASSRSGSSGDTFTHKAHRSSLTLTSSTPMSPSASRGRVSSGSGLVMRAYDPRLSPTSNRRTTTYSHVQSSGYGPSGSYVKTRPRSRSGGPTTSTQRAGMTAAPRPSFPQETVPLPAHAPSVQPKPAVAGLESRLPTQSSPAKVSRLQGSPLKPSMGYPRTFNDHGVRTPETSPRMTLRPSTSPRSLSYTPAHEDNYRVKMENTTPDPDMDIPFTPDHPSMPVRPPIAPTPPRFQLVESAPTTPAHGPGNSPPASTTSSRVTGSPTHPASSTPPRSATPTQPTSSTPPRANATPPRTAASSPPPDLPSVTVDKLCPIERIPGTWVTSELPTASKKDASFSSNQHYDENDGSASPMFSHSPADIPSTPMPSSRVAPVTSTTTTHESPESPAPASVNGTTAKVESHAQAFADPSSPLCNGNVTPVKVCSAPPSTPSSSPAGFHVAPAHHTSVLDIPFRPIKPAVKPVDPGLLFHSNRTEPKRGDPNMVRQGEVFVDRYEVVRRLGSGDWSTVWLAFDRIREIFVALKVSKETRSKALHEVNIYNQVNQFIEPEECEEGDYNCIIRMLDYFEGRVSGGLNTVMVFEVLGKDLLSLITYPNGALCYKGIPIQRAKKVAKCSLQGLAYMHDVTKVFHCDLKPENILLNCRNEEQFSNIRDVLRQFLAERQHRNARLTDDELRRYIQVTHGDPSGVKIIDLGASRAIGDTLYSVDMIQTLEYRSPEVVLGFSPVDAAIDIWSLACIMWEMLTGVYLFNPGEDKPRNPVHVGLFIARLGDFPLHMATAPGKHVSFFFDAHGAFRYQKYPHLGFQELTAKHGFSPKEADEIIDFLLPMLRYDPKERVTAREHLAHPWLAGV